MVENAIHDCFHAAGIGHAEFVEMHHQVIQPVEVEPKWVAGFKWVGFLVAGVELLVESAKDGGHADVQFAVAVNCGGVNECRLTICREHVVATP